MAAVTVRLLIKGRVQGVGYRAWTMHSAQPLGLAGWVRNLKDGSVEALAHGPEQVVERLIAACQQGPSFAEVTDVKSEYIEADKIPVGFEQLPTV